MKIIQEISLRGFEFWSGAKDRVDAFSDEQLDEIEQLLEEEYPDGMTDTQLNDLFWFEENWLARLVGYQDYEYLCKGISNEEIEEANEWFNCSLSQEKQLKLAGYSEGELEDGEIQDRIDDWWDNQQDWQRVELKRKESGEV